MRSFGKAVAVAAIAAAAAGTLSGVASAAPYQAAVVSPAVTATAKPVPGNYIVMLNEDYGTADVARAHGVAPQRVYDAAISGFAARLTPAQLRKLSRDPAVRLIEQDMRLTDMIETTQTNPPSWGIDRIDQRALPLSRSYTYNADGTGVHAYIIDTGIMTSHPDFGGRASWDYNAIDSNNTDCQGHGTHVAGTVGSKTYGVAKNVRLHAIKMMNCSGSTTSSAILSAINWVTRNAQRPAVANTSWRYSASSTNETAIRNMIASGVFLATSAGNTGGYSCDLLPRKVETAVVVASSTSTDTRSSTSSTGACVDIYAPGNSIVSTTNDGRSGTKSGTSMATPHVAGVAALYKSRYGDVSSATLHDWLTSNATPNVISGGSTGGTVNRLLNTAGL